MRLDFRDLIDMKVKTRTRGARDNLGGLMLQPDGVGNTNLPFSTYLDK